MFKVNYYNEGLSFKMTGRNYSHVRNCLAIKQYIQLLDSYPNDVLVLIDSEGYDETQLDSHYIPDFDITMINACVENARAFAQLHENLKDEVIKVSFGKYYQKDQLNPAFYVSTVIYIDTEANMLKRMIEIYSPKGHKPGMYNVRTLKYSTDLMRTRWDIDEEPGGNK